MPPYRAALALAALAGCSAEPEGPRAPRRYWGTAPAPHGSTLALAPDGRTAVVVHPDGDTVALVDVDARRLVREVPLGPTPRVAPDGRWVAPVSPNAVAVAPRRGVAYVTARNSGELLAVGLGAGAVVARAFVCTEPSSVVVAPGEAGVLVACAADREVIAVDPASLRVVARAAVDHETGALGLTDDGGAVAVTHPQTGGVTVLDAATLAVRSRGGVAALPWRGSALLANGLPRALADVAARPGARELWVAQTALSVTTAQPALDFETTVFPGLSALDERAAPAGPTLTTDSRLAGVDGALAHVTSGPRALAFTADGALALVVNLNSESLTLLDCERGVEAGHLDDLPGALHDGVVIHPDGRRAWVNARNTGTLVPLALGAGAAVRVDGAPFATRASDPMPRELRVGQWVFHTANDRYQSFPITVNRWLACESCHPNGGGASVTLRVAAGPRDVPDLRQGLDGFLMRTGTRRAAADFWRSIHVEMGGQIRPDDDLFGPPFEALVAYVERALPPLHAPRTDATLAAEGRRVFERADVGCATCHAGPRGTDSGAGNPSLDLAGPVALHDVGTCVGGGEHPDRAHEDIARGPRDACRFDTPTLRGVARTGPWLHDGSAASLRDVLTSRNPSGLHGRTGHLRPQEIDALVEFLRSF